MAAVDTTQTSRAAADLRHTFQAGLVDQMAPADAEALDRQIRSMTVELGSQGLDLADLATCSELLVFHVWVCRQLMPHLDGSPHARSVLRTIAAGLTCAPGVPR